MSSGSRFPRRTELTRIASTPCPTSPTMRSSASRSLPTRRRGRAHFRAALPVVVAEAARWETLELVPGSFVDEELVQVHSDVLHRVALHGGGELWLYVLFEHQSTVDALMPWRMLRYLVRIWERWHEARHGPSLPFVVPLVLYHGERRWTAPVDFEAMFREGAVRDALLPHIPRLRYVLQDLSVVPGRGAARGAWRCGGGAAGVQARPARDGVGPAVAGPGGGGGAVGRACARWRRQGAAVTVVPLPPAAARDDLVRRLPPEGQGLIMGTASS
ncbi:MAG: Rpn family recombination-promoting nuclease/putative transposase [Myxococcota bacterium]